MPYRLDSPRHTNDKIKQIVCECMSDAAVQLTQKRKHKSKGLHEAIHETRKHFKEIRAVLRLLRAEPGVNFDSENSWFREQARSLATLRDAKAMLETCDKLSAFFAKQLDHDPFPALHRKLDARLDVVLAEHPQLGKELAAMAKALLVAQSRVQDWPLQDKGFALFHEGLLTSYRAARSHCRKCHANPQSANFHTWRKWIKTHLYHTQLLSAAWPGELENRTQALKMLADLLGDDHDLSVLEAQIEQAPKHFGSRGEVGQLRKLLAQRHHQLRSKALALGGRLYAEKPKAHIHRLESYWACWVNDAKTLQSV
ncbi:MAG: CHAD domain-containing protein [Gammaproteobacteria bacterium]|nr:CHAD domain-containing protein [Gammaproteobacteria bacterium]MBQ0839221.1 CHAD domain-containing protein [Gammaproteobacteria bacterium]